MRACVRYSCPLVAAAAAAATRYIDADDDDAVEFDADAKRGALATGDGDAQRFIRESARTVSRVREMRAIRETNGRVRGAFGATT